jgi:RNA polymerase sigma-70 factor (ECF subfamily)
MNAEGSLQTALTSENQPMVDLTAESGSPAVFGSDDPNNPRHYTDDELVVAAQNGFSVALGLLLMRHRNSLYGTVRRMTATAEEAEDVVQDAMLRACVSIGTFRREARCSTWLIAIAKNSLFSLRRRSSSTQRIYLDDAETPSHQSCLYDLRDQSPTPEQECIGRELLARAQRDMQKLHRSYRSVLETRDIDQDSIKNCASELGITIATFKSRLSRARSRLSLALGRAEVDRSANRGTRRKKP